jgi:hypothetical protein
LTNLASSLTAVDLPVSEGMFARGFADEDVELLDEAGVDALEAEELESELLPQAAAPSASTAMVAAEAGVRSFMGEDSFGLGWCRGAW